MVFTRLGEGRSSRLEHTAFIRDAVTRAYRLHSGCCHSTCAKQMRLLTRRLIFLMFFFSLDVSDSDAIEKARTVFAQLLCWHLGASFLVKFCHNFWQRYSEVSKVGRKIPLCMFRCHRQQNSHILRLVQGRKKCNISFHQLFNISQCQFEAGIVHVEWYSEGC